MSISRSKNNLDYFLVSNAGNGDNMCSTISKSFEEICQIFSSNISAIHEDAFEMLEVFEFYYNSLSSKDFSSKIKNFFHEYDEEVVVCLQTLFNSASQITNSPLRFIVDIFLDIDLQSDVPFSVSCIAHNINDIYNQAASVVNRIWREVESVIQRHSGENMNETKDRDRKLRNHKKNHFELLTKFLNKITD